MRSRQKKKHKKTLAQKIKSQLRIDKERQQERERVTYENQERQEIKERIQVHNKAESFFDKWRVLFFGY